MDTKMPCAPPAWVFGAEAFEKSDNTVIRWLGIGAALINSRGTNILLDPMLTEFNMPMLIEMPITLEQIPAFDGMLVTHVDRDHYSVPTCLALKEKCPQYHSTQYVAALMRGEGLNGIGHDIGDEFAIGNVKVKVTPADHCWQNEDPRYQGKRVYKPEEYCGFWMDTPDGTFWSPGDSKLLKEQLMMPEPDAIFFDFSDNEWHITLKGALKMAETYPNADLILIHWGSVNRPDLSACNADPKELMKNVMHPQRVHLVAPGEPFILSKKK